MVVFASEYKIKEIKMDSYFVLRSVFTIFAKYRTACASGRINTANTLFMMKTKAILSALLWLMFSMSALALGKDSVNAVTMAFVRAGME